MDNIPMVFCSDRYLNEREFREYLQNRKQLRLALEMSGRLPGLYGDASRDEVDRATGGLADVLMFAYTGNFDAGIEMDEDFICTIERAYTTKRGLDLPMAEYIGWLICEVWEMPPRAVFSVIPGLRSVVSKNRSKLADSRSFKRRLSDGSFAHVLVVDVRR